MKYTMKSILTRCPVNVNMRTFEEESYRISSDLQSGRARLWAEREREGEGEFIES